MKAVSLGHDTEEALVGKTMTWMAQGPGSRTVHRLKLGVAIKQCGKGPVQVGTDLTMKCAPQANF